MPAGTVPGDADDPWGGRASEPARRVYWGRSLKFKEKVEALNGFENYCFTMRNTLNGEKLKERF